jgi:hypothetical protein
MVPASSVRIREAHMASKKSSGRPPSGAMLSSAIIAAARPMSTVETTASQPISAIGPADIDLSNS